MQAKPPGSPMNGNQAPMMRSQNVMGGRTPNMTPPRRNTSIMAPGNLPQSRMFADGGFSDPEPFGGPQAPPPQSADPDMDGDHDMSPTPVVKPESLNYHDDPQSCKMCQYMGQDGQCAVLQMQVNPEGACNAFEAGSPSGQDQGEGGEPGGDSMMGSGYGQQN